MPPKVEKAVLNLVEIDSSDEEEGVEIGGTRNGSSKPQVSKSSGAFMAPLPPYQNLEYRSFWKAGDYDVGATTKFNPEQGHLEHARVHPKFLHSNATSHKWAFGAIAELIDNAVDEIHNGATYVKVDKIDITKDNSPALVFQDDGGGMDPEGIRKCMSLGYSSKKAKTTIGQYGNGFKTSTMRLGADAIVFSRATRKGQATQSVGLLSYTYLRRTGQDDVIVPMVDFDVSSHWAEPLIYGSQDDWSANLKTILEWSPFASKDELMLQFEDIGPHGTKIIVYNLWLNDEGIYELGFDDDDEDIRLRDEANRGGITKLKKRELERQSHISYRIRYSLRAYASVLYLRKFNNFNIILRGKPVQQLNIADELKFSKVMMYKPQLSTPSEEVTVETTIGFIKEAPALGVNGFNVYHKNRLIRPFWKVTSDGTTKGSGVVGVLEANFIEPAHDKQDFERSSLFIRLEARLKQMIMEYWKGNCHYLGHNPPGFNAHNLQKQGLVRPPPGFAANKIFQEIRLDQPIVGVAANVAHDFSNVQPGSGCRTTIQKSSPPNQPIIDLAAGSHKEVTSVDGPSSISIDQICEENIQLFMRCEEHMQKEAELKQTILELERELEEAKSKRAQLSLLIQTKRRKSTIK